MSLYPSTALRLLFEVSVELQLRDTEDLNLTLYGLGNHSSLQPHPPEEEDGAGGERAKEDDGKGQAFYCCLPTSDPAAQSHCLLWLANQTFMTATQRPPSRVTSKGRCQDGGVARCAVWLQYKLARQTQIKQPISFRLRSDLNSNSTLNSFPQLLFYSGKKKSFPQFFLPQHGRLSTVSIHSLLPSRSLFYLRVQFGIFLQHCPELKANWSHIFQWACESKKGKTIIYFFITKFPPPHFWGFFCCCFFAQGCCCIITTTISISLSEIFYHTCGCASSFFL